MGKPSARAMTEAHSPYNFVPHTRRVVIPSWDQTVSHGHPIQEGVSGSLTIRMRPQTPVIVADVEEDRNRRKVRRHFHHRDGTPGLPGSSLRGMLRSVVEIITHSKFSRMNDFYFGVRDLHNPELYGRHMAQIKGRLPTPLVCAGWLRPNHDPETSKDFPAILEPCDYAKVEYDHIVKHGVMNGVQNYAPGQKQSAPMKYKKWMAKGESRINWRRMAVHGEVKKVFADREVDGVPRKGLYYRSTTELGTGRAGHLVFTGQPSFYDPSKPKRKGAGNPKHHDFLFLGRTNDEFRISRKVFEGFITAHSATGQQHKMTDAYNEELGFWMKQSRWTEVEGQGKKAVPLENEIPVFFLFKKGTQQNPEVRSIGLAQMFRLAYDHTTKEMAPQVWHEVEETGSSTVVEYDSERLPFDMAELMFGHIDDFEYKMDGRREKNQRALKGRVQIGHARLVGHHKYLPVVGGVLGGPKASFYPYYIEQRDENNPGSAPAFQGSKPVYKTFMDSPDQAQIRGYKRYVIRPEVIAPTLPKINGKIVENDKVMTFFEPVSSDGYFETTINVHNLHPVEFGALVWAIRFGGHEGALHQIGMAKPLGYGSMKVEISGNSVMSLASLFSDDATPVDLDAYQEMFAQYMEQAVDGWSYSRRIFELLMMATPLSKEASDKAKHPELSHPEYRNMFAGTKKAGLALPARGSKLEYDLWARERRQHILAAEQAAEEQRLAEAAAAEKAAHARELARIHALSPTERALDVIVRHAGDFQSGPWYDWILGNLDGDWLEHLPLFSELNDTQAFMTALDAHFDLWKMRAELEGYAGEQQQELKAVFDQYIPREEVQAKVGISKKDQRKLKKAKDAERTARRLIDLLETGNVKKNDAQRTLTILLQEGLIPATDCERLRALYDAQED